MVDFCVPVSLPFKLTESSVVAVIPARYHSTRLPGKALADIAGHPMIEHVYRRASAARTVTRSWSPPMTSGLPGWWRDLAAPR